MCQQGGWASKGGEHEAVYQQGCWASKGGGLGGPTSIGEGNECQRGRWAPNEGGLWDHTSVGEENETFLIRVWKPLRSRRVLKTVRGSPKGKTQRLTISASGRLELCYRVFFGFTLQKTEPFDTYTSKRPCDSVPLVLALHPWCKCELQPYHNYSFCCLCSGFCRIPMDLNCLRAVECISGVDQRSKYLRSTVAYQILLIFFENEVILFLKISMFKLW